MPQRSGSANLPLHGGRVPAWFSQRMTRLGTVMCEAIVHRGPDSEGMWLDDTVALGMRRLSIIDLKTGDKPVFNEDKSVIVMMNGEQSWTYML